MNATPLAVFAYNRPEYLKNTLDSLARCYRLDECDIFIFVDGPRSLDQAERVQATRNVAQEWIKKHKGQLVISEKNAGLAVAIQNGVTQLCREYGRIIVVEDDLSLSPAFVNYMLQALERYENDDSVGQIAGYMYPVEHHSEADALFLPMTNTIGWATWQRVWCLFDENPSNALLELQNKHIRSRFDLENVYPYSVMLENRLSGKAHSWGVLFYWAIFFTQKLVLFPKYTHVHHEGNYSGTNVNAGWYENLSWKTETWTPDHHFVFPEHVKVDEGSFMRVRKYLREFHRPVESLSFRAILKKIKNRILGL